MSDRSPRYAIAAHEADLIRRAIGAALRPRRSMKELATDSGADYDMLRDFLRSRSSSFRTGEDRESIRRCAEQCIGLLGLRALSDAKQLPAYAPRRTRQKDSISANIPERLLLQVHTLLKGIPEQPVNHAASLLTGAFNCYRILDDKLIRSKLYIYRRQEAAWLEFVELWSRDGDLVEYRGYIFPTSDFLYSFGIHYKYGVPRTMFGRISVRKGHPLYIVGIVTGHSPARGVVVSSQFFMEKVASAYKGSQDFRRNVSLEDTGDFELSVLPVAFGKISNEQRQIQGLVRVQSEAI